MDAQLTSYYQLLEQQRQEFSAWVTKSPHLAQHRNPAPGQWSAAQVLYHLVQVDIQVVKALEKKLAGGKPLKPIGWGTRFRSTMLNILLKLPLKFKAPAEVSEVPAQVVVEQVIKEWEVSRHRLKAFLASFPTTQTDKEIFFHPRSGMLTLPQTLRFMVEHAEHHRRQFQRLLS